MKVLIVSPLPPPAGGIASWSERVLREAAGHNALALSHVNTAVRWRSTNDNGLGARLLGGALQAFRDTFRVSCAFLHSRPDVLHLCTSGSLATPKDALILGVARIMGIRSVVHYHMGRLPGIISTNSWEWKFVRRAMKLADSVLLLDKISEEAVKNALPGSRVQVIPNPGEVNTSKETSPRETGKRSDGSPAKIVFAGWVVPAKGVRELVEACSGLEDVPFQLDLIGSVTDDFRVELEALAAKRDSGGWLRFHGMVGRHEALSAIGSADVFVLPSYTEGFPSVVSEAMALGRPIVATRVGAVPEMLGETTSEPCGIVVAPRNVKELFTAVTYLLTRPDEAVMFGERARKKALALYSPERVVQRYAELWNSLARQESRSAT